MKILDIRILKGPNYWSIKHKTIEVLLNIGKFEELPTNRINGFHETLANLLPGLQEHHCSLGRLGGFLERVKEGTWMGHVVEHIAVELQLMAGFKCGFGKTISTKEKGVYRVIFAYEEERAGLYAAQASVRIAEALFNSQHYDLKSDLSALKKIAAEDKLGPSTFTIVEAAKSRNIPVIRLDSGSLVQLGFGCEQKRIEATITENTSSIAVELACNKHKTKSILKEAAIVVPEGFLIKSPEELERVIREMGFPLVIKPNNSSQGKGVTIEINSREKALRGYEKARLYGEEVLVEKYYSGNDYRLLVVNYKLVAAAKRTPAMITGDGILKVRELIDFVNLDPSRGEDHENNLTKIKIDASTEEILRFQDISLDYIPPAGKTIYLKQTANLSTGGTSEDVTDLVHPEIRLLSERVARVIGLDICGIDFISEDIALSLKEGNGVVIEVNAAPGFRMHTHPVKGKSRNVGEAVIDMLFPKKTGRIPIVAVTGTNGKTTTTRLIAHIARTAGYHTGYTTSDGIYMGTDRIEEGDCTGFNSSRKILRDKSINFAVLECARGGLLHSGLGFDQCDVGIITNVAEDHLGLNGIHTLEEMAWVKSVIPETVKPNGVAILNADDPLTCAMKDKLKSRIALFSTQLSSCVLDHCRKGGIAAVYKDRRILLIKGNTIFLNESVYTIPLSFGGKALFMIENILAAVLAAYFTGIDLETISKALHSFVPSFENLPGRMNLFRFKDFRFLLDYAHNSHGIIAIGSLLKKENYSFKTGIITAPGDRRDIDLINVGKASADIFDKIIIRVDEDTRGRTENEIIDLLLSGIRSANKNLPVEVIKRETEAIEHTILNAEQGSIIVLFSDKINKCVEVIKKFIRKEEMQKEKILKNS